MTQLVWANFPLMALFALAIAGIPIWMVFRRPDRAPDHTEAHAYLRARAGHLRRPEPSTAAPAPGTAAPAQVKAMAAAASDVGPRRGRWRLAAPRGGMPGRRHPATGPAGRPKDRGLAARRSRSGS